MPLETTASHVTLPLAIEQIVAANLARLRAKRALSLDALARLSGVSRAMLAQVESGKSVPSIRLLHRVALALEVSVPAFLREESVASIELLPAQHAKRLVSPDGRVSSRSLFPVQRQRRAEFHEISLAADAGERLAALPPGSCKNLVLVYGLLDVRVRGHVQRLVAGDALFFDADSPHSFHNPDPALPALLHVVTHLPEARAA